MAEDFQLSCNWWNASLAASSTAAVGSSTMQRRSDESTGFGTLQLSAFGPATCCTDWSQNPHIGERAVSSFHTMHHDEAFFRQELGESSPMVQFYDCSSPMTRGLMEADTRLHQHFFNSQQATDHYQPQMTAVYREVSNEMQQQQQQPDAINYQQQLSFWNASSGFPPVSVSSPGTQILGMKPSCSKSAGREKKNSSEPAVKKLRTETPSASPLPAFKVRKEKLGDRITALQQLVSPFGKSDTASVLHEAIEYIKFLHDQVGALSTPYLMNGHPTQQQKNSDYKSRDGEENTRQDLRSRGLCLVPVASMAYTVVSETSADLWINPTFGGAYNYR